MASRSCHSFSSITIDVSWSSCFCFKMTYNKVYPYVLCIGIVHYFAGNFNIPPQRNFSQCNSSLRADALCVILYKDKKSLT